MSLSPSIWKSNYQKWKVLTGGRVVLLTMMAMTRLVKYPTLTALSSWAVPNCLSTELNYTQHFHNQSTVSFVTCDQLNHATWLRVQYLANYQESLTQTVTAPLTVKVTVLKVTGLSCWLHDLHWRSSPKVSPQCTVSLSFCTHSAISPLL